MEKKKKKKEGSMPSLKQWQRILEHTKAENKHLFDLYGRFLTYIFEDINNADEHKIQTKKA